MATPDILQLKITLLGTQPPIWRRLLVPSSMTLAALHQTIQLSFGWTESHLHEFTIAGISYGNPEMLDGGIEDEDAARLSSVLHRKGMKGRYVYDFGDDWTHEILLEKKLEEDTTVSAVELPVCIDGKLLCPPEDCGGVGGFYDLVEAMADPEHPRHEELSEWLDEPFSPKDFSIEQTNLALAPLRKKSTRKRATRGA